MDKLLHALGLLPLMDWLAVAVFFASWAAYARFARHQADGRDSLLAVTNRWRWRWMMQVTHRDVRVVDGVVVQNLSTSPSFFASTTILILGGLLAALGSGDKATELVMELPFTARTSAPMVDLKLLLLAGIFVYAFFRFTWSMRQYTFGALLIGAIPERWQFDQQGLSREAHADRAGRVVGLAAEAFNDGLRAYYLSFAALGWFFSPLAFVLATWGVIYVLYQREFHSDVLSVLRDSA